MDERREAPRVALRPEIEATVNDVPVRIVELSAVGTRIEHEQRFPLTSPELSVTWQGTSVKLSVRIIRSEIVGRTAAGLTYRTGMQFTGDRLLAESVVTAILGNGAPSKGAAQETAPAASSAPEAETPVALPPEPTVVASPQPAPPVAPPAAGAADVPPQSEPERAEPVVASPPASPPAPPAAPPGAAPAPPPSLDDTWTRQVRFLKKDPEDEMPYAQFRRTADGWKKSYVATPEQPPDGFTIRRDDLDIAELQHTFDCADPETRRMMQIALQTKLESELTTKS